MATATEPILVKFTPELLADVDRMRGQVPRTVWIKGICRSAVEARERFGGPCLLRVVGEPMPTGDDDA